MREAHRPVSVCLDGFPAATAESMVLTGGSPGDGTPLTATLGGARDQQRCALERDLPIGAGGEIAVTVEPTTAIVIRIRGWPGPAQTSP